MAAIPDSSAAATLPLPASTEPVIHSAADAEATTSTGLPNRKLAFWAFLASDCMFFGALISTYLVYHGKSQSGPIPTDVFDIPLTSISTGVLLLSSLMMVLALHALQDGNLGRFRLWNLVTIVCGLIFLGFQYFEFSHFVGEGLKINTNLFGSTFYSLTGTHGVHVAIGVFWLSALEIYSFFGGVTKERALDVELAGLYWHFVDIVWIVIFTVVYLIEFTGGAPLVHEAVKAVAH